MDEEEKKEAIRKQLMEELKVSDKDSKKIMEKIEKKINSYEKIKRLRWSIMLITVNFLVSIFYLFLGITETKPLFIVIFFAFIGLIFMEILMLVKKFPEEYEKQKMLKYCAQINNSTAADFTKIKKQDMFSTINEAKDWIYHISKEGEDARIMDAFTGKIVAYYKKKKEYRG